MSRARRRAPHALGMQHDEANDEDINWFTVGEYLFAGPHWAILGGDERQFRMNQIGIVIPFRPIAGEGLRFDGSVGIAF